MNIKHYIFADNRIREFSNEEGSRVANGERLLPEYADSKLRYVQVVLDPNESKGALQVQIAGAYLQFDEEGRLKEAGAREVKEADKFEHETCVQLALSERYREAITLH